MTKVNKPLYTLSKKRNSTNYANLLKYLGKHATVVNSCGGKTPVNPGLVKVNITDMEFTYVDKLIHKEKLRQKRNSSRNIWNVSCWLYRKMASTPP